jgi:hypothetical protein
MSVLRGEDAVRAAAQLLPHLNRNGASARVVSDAIKLATEHDDPQRRSTPLLGTQRNNATGIAGANMESCPKSPQRFGSDDLFLPQEISTRLGELKREGK